MTRLRSLLLGTAAAIAVASAGCGDDGHTSTCGLEANCMGLLSYQANMVVQGDNGLLGIKLVSSDPAPPEVQATWVVEVVDASGNTVSGASITSANAWSIDCGHYGLQGGDGVTVTDNSDDTFTLVPDYAHGGPWDVEFTVSDGTNTDDVELGFCLPETGGHEH